MERRVIRRALVVAMTILILTAAVADAETVGGDGDLITPGLQGTIDLGTATPGQDVRVDVRFILECTGTSHVDASQMVRLTPGAITVPPGGSFGIGSVLFAPGAGWPADGEACPANLVPVASPPMRVTVTAPNDPGIDYRYAFTWTRSLVPTSAGDAAVFEGTAPTLTFLLDVADNTPPTLDLPADSTFEGNASGGALAAYTVSASDAEDATAPTPVCNPAVGDLLPLGTTSIDCTATDGGGLTATGSFAITVVDTTAPQLSNMPADQSLVTSDPAGATLVYSLPTAADIVDPAPALACLPASGSVAPIGPTTVTCTATDASGNPSSASFQVSVTFVPAIAWTATWGEPIPSDGGSFVVNPGRSVPIKVEVFANGVERTSGHILLIVTACDGGADLSVVLGRDAGRWTGKLDTSLLGGPGCYVAAVTVDGVTADSIRIDLRGSTTAASGGPKGNQKR
jgi:hypothetical protein